MELLILLGHEADASTLQAALDTYVKTFLAAAEEVLQKPPPPAQAGDAGVQAAKTNMAELQHRLYEVQHATWKWDVLRPVDAV